MQKKNVSVENRRPKNWSKISTYLIKIKCRHKILLMMYRPEQPVTEPPDFLPYARWQSWSVVSQSNGPGTPAGLPQRRSREHDRCPDSHRKTKDPEKNQSLHNYKYSFTKLDSFKCLSLVLNINHHQIILVEEGQLFNDYIMGLSYKTFRRLFRRLALMTWLI